MASHSRHETVRDVWVIAFALVILFSSCTKSIDAPGPELPGRTEHPVITIGAISTMTGSAAIYGEAFNTGVQQALSEINANDMKIAFILEDNRNDPKEAIAAYGRLRQQNLDIIFSTASGSTVAITPLVAQDGTPLFGTITTATFNAQYNNSFKYYLSGTENADALVPFLKKRNARTVALYYVNNEAGVAAITPVEERLRAEGFDIIAKEGFAVTDTEHRTAMQKIAAKKPDALYIWAFRPDQVVGAAKSSYNGSIIFSEIPVTLRLYQQSDAFDGTYDLAMAFAVPGSAQSEAFTQKFGETQNGYAAFGYDLVYIVWNELQAGATPDNIIERVAAHSTYSGLLGDVTIHKELRQIDTPLQVVQIQNRTLVAVE